MKRKYLTYNDKKACLCINRYRGGKLNLYLSFEDENMDCYDITLDTDGNLLLYRDDVALIKEEFYGSDAFRELNKCGVMKILTGMVYNEEQYCLIQLQIEKLREYDYSGYQQYFIEYDPEVYDPTYCGNDECYNGEKFYVVDEKEDEEEF